MSNPIRLVYDALWDTLEAEPDFLTLFPTARQVRYNSALSYAPEPDLSEAAPADYPRCRIVVAGVTSGLDRTTDCSELTVHFRVEVCTGQQMQGVLMDAIWAIYRGYANWFTELKTVALGFGSVVDLADEQIAVGDDDNPKMSRGTDQWLAVCQASVRMIFPTSSLLE